MKKVYLLTGALFAVTCLQAQQLVPYANFGQKKAVSAKSLVKHKTPHALKSEGDPIYESDFSDPTEWTFTDNSVPAMGAGSLNIGTDEPTGDFSSGMGAIESTTAANGFALIDSDGGYTNTGQQDVKLTFNTVMDFTSYPNVTLQFQSYHRVFNDSIYVEFYVNGAWEEYQIEIDPALSSGDMSDNPMIYDINVSSIVGGEANVQMRFHYEGEWDYAWMIDDVVLYETYANEMILGQVYNSTPGAEPGDGEDYYKIPASQASFPGLIFGAFAENQGAANQVARLSVSLNGGTATLGDPASIPSEEQDSIVMTDPIPLVSGTNTFTLSTDIGATDANPANNETEMVVTWGGNEFSRHDGIARKYFNYVATEDGFRAGNLYVIQDAIAVASVRARINNDDANPGNIMFADIELFDVDNGVYNSLGLVETEVTVDDNGDYVEFDFSGEGIELAAGAVVRVWVGNYTEGGYPVRISTAQKTLPQISYIGFYDAGSNTYETFWTDDTPMISLVEGVASVDENAAKFALNMFPNPANEQTKVSFQLDNTSDVAISVTDLSGKVVYTTSMANAAAGKHTLEISTADFASGVYAVKFSANNAVATKKLVVKK